MRFLGCERSEMGCEAGNISTIFCKHGLRNRCQNGGMSRLRRDAPGLNDSSDQSDFATRLDSGGTAA